MDSIETSPELLCRDLIYDNNAADYMVRYYGPREEIINYYQAPCIQFITNNYAFLHIPITSSNDISIHKFGYLSVPKCFGLLDTSNMEESGILRLRRQPYLDLLGRDILMGFIDTGIDYTHTVFRNADNTSRIYGIWDQTIQEGPPPENFVYGKEFTNEMLNEALQSDDPLSIAPTTDTIGHGTFMAGIAAGNEDPENDFTGAAPLARIAMVKLKPAKQTLKEFFGIYNDAPCYQENDIIAGVRYLSDKASELKIPLIICIGVGTNSGNHAGNLFLCSLLDNSATSPGLGIIAAAGNEANLGHHFEGIISENAMEDVELEISENSRGFSMEIWTQAPNVISIGLISPLGEVISEIPIRQQQEQVISFLFEDTIVYVNYSLTEVSSGDELVFLRFVNPTAGLWRIRIYAHTSFPRSYNIWLPMEAFIPIETHFLKSNPDTTICEPGNTSHILTASTYNHRTNSIYLNSSRGYTSEGLIKPDLAAPGVSVYGPISGNGFSTMTGSSIAAAHTAGAAALLMEWGIVQKHNITMNTSQIKSILIKGATRTDILYPNRSWGYGSLNIYNAFQSMRAPTLER